MAEVGKGPSDGAVSVPWIDMPPNPEAKQDSSEGIRKEMLAILKAAGEAGVLTQGFGHLDWRDGLRKDKLYKAMGYLANESGLTLQYQGVREGKTYPFRWRIKP